MDFTMDFTIYFYGPWLYHGELLVITRGYIPLNPIKPPFSYGFSYGSHNQAGSMVEILEAQLERQRKRQWRAELVQDLRMSSVRV